MPAFGKASRHPATGSSAGADHGASALKSLVDNSDRLSQLEGQKSQLESTLAKLKQELSASQGEKQSLSDELTTAKDKLAALRSKEECVGALLCGTAGGAE